MKAADLINHVTNAANIEKSASKRTLDAVLEGIIEATKRGEEVNLTGFGKFRLQNSAGSNEWKDGHGKVVTNVTVKDGAAPQIMSFPPP